MADDENRLVNVLIDALQDISRRSTSSTVKARPPKQYSQNTDFDAFVRLFENYAELVGIPEDRRKQSLLNLLDSTAFHAVSLLNLPADLAYDRFVRRLSKRFEQKDITDYKRIFRNCCQLETETIPQFRDRVVEITAKAYPETDPSVVTELSKDAFLEGLGVPTSIKQHLFIQNPHDINTACRLALKFQAAHRAAGSTEELPIPKARSKRGILASNLPSETDSETEMQREIKTLTQKVEKLQADLAASRSVSSRSPLRSRSHSAERKTSDHFEVHPDQHLNWYRGAKVSFAPRAQDQGQERNYQRTFWNRKKSNH